MDYKSKDSNVNILKLDNVKSICFGADQEFQGDVFIEVGEFLKEYSYIHKLKDRNKTMFHLNEMTYEIDNESNYFTITLFGTCH